MGSAPLTDVVFVEPGEHRVEAKLSGYDDGSVTVQAAKGSAPPVTLALALSPPPKLPPTLPPTPAVRPPTWLLVTGGVLAAGGIAVGAGLTVAANGKGAQANTLGATLPLSSCAGAGGAAADCGALKTALRNESTLSDAAVTSFMVGGALALATAALGVWAGVTPATVTANERPAALRVMPVMGAQGGGVMMVGAW